MKLIWILAPVAALLAPSQIRADAAQASPQVGEEFEIIRSYETSQEANDGSSGSSSDQDTILERVIAVRETGLELEYDFPKGATVEDKARDWQFPARILKRTTGPIQLLNGQEMEARVEAWLKAAKWTRAMCGRWIFTWNAFHIECDPQSVIKTIEVYDLSSTDVRDGAPYREIAALGSGTFAKMAVGAKGSSFAAALQIDPDAVRRSRAESDVVIGEITQKPVTLDAAIRERAKEIISGTILVTFDTDSAGNVLRKTKVTKLETKLPSGKTQSDTATEIIERKRLSKPSTRS